MTETYLPPNDLAQQGKTIRACLQTMDQWNRDTAEILPSMRRLVTGDGSDAGQFAELKLRYGFSTNEEAKVAFDKMRLVAALPPHKFTK